jgi:hypothetical protein
MAFHGSRHCLLGQPTQQCKYSTSVVLKINCIMLQLSSFILIPQFWWCFPICLVSACLIVNLGENVRRRDVLCCLWWMIMQLIIIRGDLQFT